MTAVPRIRHPRPYAECHAFTLLEVVVAMLAASMLLVGLSSALYLTIQATEPDLGGHDSQFQAGTALAELASELRFAQTFLERSETAVEFTVADRDNDAGSETIRWEWSGTPGDPLTRTYNGGATVTVLENVHDFTLAFGIDEVTTTEPGAGESTSDEFLMASFEGWAGVSHSTLNYGLGPSNRAAESFVAQGIPAEATAVEITRASFRLRNNSGGTLQASVHKTIGGGNIEPEAAQIGSGAVVDVTTLPASFGWVDIDFTDATIAGYQDEFVVILAGSIASGASVEYYSASGAPADSTFMLYGNTSWSPPSFLRNRYDIPFKVYGRYSLASGGETEVTRYFVSHTTAALQVGDDSDYARRASTEILNRPEVLSP